MNGSETICCSWRGSKRSRTRIYRPCVQLLLLEKEEIVLIMSEKSATSKRPKSPSTTDDVSVSSGPSKGHGQETVQGSQSVQRLATTRLILHRPVMTHIAHDGRMQSGLSSCYRSFTSRSSTQLFPLVLVSIIITQYSMPMSMSRGPTVEPKLIVKWI